ncbi:MAG: STAS domain-containing protein [Flavobacteriales bacterium]|nr:STAS domain-containing protein [Flavobacteriales bacterium]
MSTTAYSIEKQEKYTEIAILEDKFTARIAPELKTELVVLKDASVKNMIFDMSKCLYCDSSGLSVILVANRICKENNGCLVVCELNPAVAKLIDISQLSSILNITPTLAEAVDYLFMDELEKGLSETEENLN